MRSRSAVSLLEALVAITILAVLGGPMIANMVSSRRSARTSAQGIRAVLRAGAVMERLQSVPFELLPVVPPGEENEREEEPRGLGPGRWDLGFRVPEGGVGLGSLLPPDPPGGDWTTFVWIEELSDELDPEQVLKEVTVVVEYPVRAGDRVVTRHHALRALRLPPLGNGAGGGA